MSSTAVCSGSSVRGIITHNVRKQAKGPARLAVPALRHLGAGAQPSLSRSSASQGLPRCSRRCVPRAALGGAAALPPPPELAPALPLLPPLPASSNWQRIKQQLTRIAGMAVVAGALALSWAAPAEAARSGSRMGGSAFGGSRFGGATAFSGGSSYGSSGFRSSYGSSPLSGGFGFGGAGSMRSGPMGGGYGSGGMTGYRSSGAPSVRMNSFFLSPFGFGYGWGFGYPMVGFGGGGVMSILFWGAFAVIMLQVMQGVARAWGWGGGYDDGYDYGGGGNDYEEVVTVGKVQVGLLGSARELQKDLERIADRADTDSPEGLHYILQETVLSLMRNPDYCLYGFAKSKRERSAEEAETQFNQLSLQERGKFQKETRVNVGGMARRSSLNKEYKDGDKELIVVTLLVAADGSFKLPKVDSRESLRQALATLGSVRADDVLAVEVLWTPEEEGDYFTVEDLAYDYPTLNTL